jgi:hypothetical protein
MAIDGEPKDGDYVRYIERLVNRGGLAPGQVPPPARKDAARSAQGTGVSSGQSSTLPSTPAPAPAGAEPWGRADGGAGTMHQTGSAKPGMAAPTPQPTTLAAQAGARIGARILKIVGAVLLFAAFRMGMTALQGPDHDPARLIPAAFLAIFGALLLFRSRGLNQKARQPLGSLPPLTTASTRNGRDGGR